LIALAASFSKFKGNGSDEKEMRLFVWRYNMYIKCNGKNSNKYLII